MLTKKIFSKSVLATTAALAFFSGSSAFAATLKSTATQVVTLAVGNARTDNQSGMAYDPVSGLYHSGNAGSPIYNGFTWNGSGVLQSSGTQGVDVRGIWYNSNTGSVEANSYNSGAPGQGLYTLNLDGSGNFVDSGTQIRSLPGSAGVQSVMDYDASRNVLYSRSLGNTVNVIDYATGALTSSIALAGMTGGTQSYTIGFMDTLDALVTYDQSSGMAQVFDMAGTELGSVSVGGISSSTNFGMTYENGLLFIFDTLENAWNGYDLSLIHI